MGKYMYVSKEFSILPEVEWKQDPFIKNQPIILLHIAKNGGTSINYLTRAFLAQEKLAHKILSGACVSSKLNEVLITPKCYDIITEGCVSGIQVLKNKPEVFDLTNNPQLQYISAHMPLPEYNYFKLDVSYIAIIRNPVDRALSLGNYLYQSNYVKEELIETLLLDVEIDNVQTRWMAGEKYMTGACNEETFAQAIKNIQEIFTLTAPIEDLEVVMALIAKHFGYGDIAYAKVNVTKDKVKGIDKQNIELCQKLLAKNHYDKNLHEYVKTHWESWKLEHIESITDNT
jgi:hypothetical protein